MTQTNCIVLDNGYSFSVESKLIKAPNGTTVADLYHIDINKFSEAELIELAIKFSCAYELGQNVAKKALLHNITKIFKLED